MLLASPHRVVVGLGSNLGDRQAHLQYAVSSLKDFLVDLVVSESIETDPQGLSPPGSPPFLNAVAVGWSSDSPETQLLRLHRIEDRRGRIRTIPGAPRTLDLDLIFVGDIVIKTATITLPHPRFQERSFVLGPLSSICPDLIDPVSGFTVRDLFKRL